MVFNRRDTFNDLFNEVNRLQDEFGRVFGRFGGTREALATLPLVNVWEDEHAVYAETDLPGIDPTKLDVHVTEGNQLTVQGERGPGDLKSLVWHRQERPVGQFTRAVTLPALVDADRVEAKYDQGVLRLTLPKHEAAKPRRIAVTA